MNNIKVLHIINNLGSGGAEKLIEQSLPIMNEKENIEVELLLLTKENNVFEEKLKEAGVKISVIGTNNIYNPINIISIRKFIKNNNFDIIHSHLFPVMYWTSLAVKSLFNTNFKLFFTEHSTHNKRRNYFFFRPVEKFIYNEFDKVISISRKTETNLLEWLEIKKNKKFTIIENGIDAEKFNSSKPYSKEKFISNCTDNNIFVTMVGRFSDQKDQKTLIKALDKLSDNVHLFLVGEGNLLEYHKEYTNDLGLKDRVHFLGFRNDVDRILKTTDIVVLSSHWEGFGLASVEGMAAGKPVIASNVSGLREVVKDAGLLFEQGNEEELAKIIDKLINDRKYYELISQKCLNKSKAYEIQNMCKRLLHLYKR